MKPEIRIFPTRDQAFRGEVERAIASLDLSPKDAAAPNPHALIAALRPTYPNVRVTTQDDLGSIDLTGVVWYVFRDRRVRTDDWRRERLYSALARARTVIRCVTVSALAFSSSSSFLAAAMPIRSRRSDTSCSLYSRRRKVTSSRSGSK